MTLVRSTNSNGRPGNPDIGATTEYGQLLFDTFENFLPTRSLYVDFEGSGSGTEDIFTLYWPQNSGEFRTAFVIRRPQENAPTIKDLRVACEQLDVEPLEVKHIVVFSGGPVVPDEMIRFEEVFGEGWTTPEQWINLHALLRDSQRMKRAIRQRRFVWHTGETRTRYSLEALEREFRIIRPGELRSRSNSYSDSSVGSFSPLELSRLWVDGSIDEEDLGQLKTYCRYDVESMFKISRECEKLIFSKRERARRFRRFG
jgi:hypothetical protein